jgi:hypothetical protein
LETLLQENVKNVLERAQRVKTMELIVLRVKISIFCLTHSVLTCALWIILETITYVYHAFLLALDATMLILTNALNVKPDFILLITNVYLIVWITLFLITLHADVTSATLLA